jgi:hypothetical protein
LVSRMGNNFKKAGDINKASQGLSQKILKFWWAMIHWEHEVKDHDKIFISRFQVIRTECSLA